MKTQYLLLAVLVSAGVTATSAGADESPVQAIPAGTHIAFHVDAPVSSNESKTGETFTFELVGPIALTDRSIPVDGSTGSGTIFLAGRAGTSGHEGDLTLRLDRLTTQDGRMYTFDDQRLKIDGRNRKVTSALLSLVPFAGFGARFIRGSEVRVDSTMPIDTVLARPAVVAESSCLYPTSGMDAARKLSHVCP